MKALFICNKPAVEIIGKHLKSNKIFGIKNDLDFDKDYINKAFIYSLEDYNDRKEDFTGKSNSPYYVFYIDPYLQWGGHNFFGYQLALAILRNWKGKKPPAIVFLSLITQIDLNKIVTGKLNVLVREFQHIDLLSLTSKKSLPTNTFSENRWKYLKAYALTSSGILDEISHELTTIILQSEKSRSNLELLINRIFQLSDTVGENVINLINSYDEENEVSSFAKELKDKIDSRLNELSPHKQSEIAVPSNLNILIVEDNLEHLGVLEEALTSRSNYFEKGKTLFSYTNGEEALNELKKSKNEYQLVLVDLRLNDENGFSQPVHGVDIIEELQKNHPLSSYTIITGMGRKGISELLNLDIKFILSKKQLYSFDTYSEVDAMLQRMFKDVAHREKSIHYNFGPTGGIYGWTMFKSNLFALDRELLNAQIKKAFVILDDFKQQSLNQELKIYSPKQKDKYDINKLDEYHTNMLALRMIYLWLALKQNNRLVCSAEEQEEYYDVLSSNGISLSYGRAKDIGLAHIKSYKEGSLKVLEFDLKNIWPHEKTIVEERAEVHQEKYIDYLEDIVISEQHPALLRFIKTYFDYEEDQLQGMNVPLDFNFWNFNNLNTFLSEIFNDYLDKGQESVHFAFIEAMCNDDNSMDYFQHQVEPYLPEIDKLFREIYDNLF